MNENEKQTIDNKITFLTANVASTAKLVESLTTEVKEHSYKLTTATTILQHTQDTMNKLSQVILSNSGDSLLIKFSILENKIKTLEQWKDFIENGATNNRNNNWQLMLVLIGGFLGVVGSFITSLIALFK